VTDARDVEKFIYLFIDSMLSLQWLGAISGQFFLKVTDE